MRITLRGRRWELRWARLKDHGDIQPPHIKGKTIRISRGGPGSRILETLIHEMLHACLWDLSEDSVEKTAEDITRTLIRLGVEPPNRWRF